MSSTCPVLLMIRSLGIGGSERQTAATARFLAGTRFEPHVACFRPEGIRATELEKAGIPVVHLPVTSFRRPSLLHGVSRLRRYLKDKNIRIVHAFDTPMNMFGIPASLPSGRRLLLASQRAHRELTTPVSRAALRMVDRLADGVVTNCEAIRVHLQKDEGVSPDRVHVCYNGIDTDVYKPGNVNRPAPVAGGPVIGIVCALRPEKGLDTLLQAFARIAPMWPAARLAIVGSGPEEAALKQAARELGIAAATHFEPQTADVRFWLRCMDIFVLPSLSEALSNSLMEAMACGCCPVASRVGGNPELVVEGETGLLFPAGNAEALAAQLQSLLGDEHRRSAMAHAAAARIATQFTWQAAASRMAEIYETCLFRKFGQLN